MHVFMIIGFIILIKYSLKNMISNKDVYDSLNSLIGPTIGGVSFYFSPFVKSFARKYAIEPDQNMIKSYYFKPHNKNK